MGVDLALHPETGLVLQVGDAEKFPQVLYLPNDLSFQKEAPEVSTVTYMARKRKLISSSMSITDCSSSIRNRSHHNHHSCYSTTIAMHYLCVYMPPAFRPSYRKVNWGSLTCAMILVHAVHMKVTGTDESAQMLTRKNQEMVLHPVTSLSRSLASALTVLHISQPALNYSWSVMSETCTYHIKVWL